MKLRYLETYNKIEEFRGVRPIKLRYLVASNKLEVFSGVQ